MTWGSVAGTATINVTGATLADPVNTMWDTSSFLTNGTIAVVPVPEPSTVLLTVLGREHGRRNHDPPPAVQISNLGGEVGCDKNLDLFTSQLVFLNPSPRFGSTLRVSPPIIGSVRETLLTPHAVRL